MRQLKLRIVQRSYRSPAEHARAFHLAHSGTDRDSNAFSDRRANGHSNGDADSNADTQPDSRAHTFTDTEAASLRLQRFVLRRRCFNFAGLAHDRRLRCA